MSEVRLIDANALYNDLKASAKEAREWREETQDEEIKIRAEQAYGTFVECALRVKNAPTIYPEVRYGRWKCICEYEEFSEVMADYLCESCGYVISRLKNQKPKFCEGCGARMDLRTPTEVQLDEADSVIMGGADNVSNM